MFRSRVISQRQFFLPKCREISNPVERYQAMQRIKQGQVSTSTRSGGSNVQSR